MKLTYNKETPVRSCHTTFKELENGDCFIYGHCDEREVKSIGTFHTRIGYAKVVLSNSTRYICLEEEQDYNSKVTKLNVTANIELA